MRQEKIRQEKTGYDYYIEWKITGACNFDCDYCSPNDHLKFRPLPIDIKKVIDRLDRLNKTVLFTILGGEPFLISNFTEFIEQLTKKHYVIIDTNLSIKGQFDRFIKNVDSERVLKINFSTHILERSKKGLSLEELCYVVNKFKDAGFSMRGNYVAHPNLLGRLEKDMSFFKKNKIEVYPTLFQGTFDGKEYPINDKGERAYSKDELSLIKRYNPEAKIENFVTLNTLCIAGTSAFLIDNDIVTPCYRIKKRLGTFYREWKRFDRLLTCPYYYCNCPFSRNFITFSDIKGQTRILDKTIKEKGLFSMAESKKIIHTPKLYDLLDPLIGKIGIFIRVNMPDLYYHLVKFLR